MPNLQLPGLSPTAYEPAYGGVPGVTDPNSSAANAIAGNLGNLSSLYSLAGGINSFNAGQAAGQYAANLPDYSAMMQKSSDDILANLSGEVPQDVQNLLSQQAAERGISTGLGGSDNSNAALLRSLGLTSIGQETLGQQQLTSAIQRTPTSPLFNVASMLTTPSDQQEAQMYANLMAAAPKPGDAARQAIQNALAALMAGKNAGGGGGPPGDGGGGPTGGGGFPSLYPFGKTNNTDPFYGGGGTLPGNLNRNIVPPGNTYLPPPATQPNTNTSPYGPSLTDLGLTIDPSGNFAPNLLGPSLQDLGLNTDAAGNLQELGPSLNDLMLGPSYQDLTGQNYNPNTNSGMLGPSYQDLTGQNYDPLTSDQWIYDLTGG